MVNSKELQGCVNSMLLFLKKLELELKCPTCLKLFERPVILPCAHLVCSPCITYLEKSGCECPLCNSSFVCEELQHSNHVESMVRIYKDISYVTADFNHRSSQKEIFEEKDEVAVSDSGDHHKIKRCVMVEGKEAKKEIDIGSSKRQKLGSELNVGHNDGISSRDLMTPDLDSGQNYRSCSHIHQLHASKCAFCHSFRTTEGTGKMLHFLKGKGVDGNQAIEPNVLHVHEKCIQWAPRIYFSGETIKNLEAELTRTSRIKCSSCGLRGAALGCYVRRCRKSYHVPCAYDILECRWDCENYHLLCPSHSSHKLPCDESRNRLEEEEEPEHSSGSYSAEHGHSAEYGHLFGAGRDWVLCGSALTEEDKDLLHQFACISGAVVVSHWEPCVTHVIASVNERGECNRVLKVLMGVLTGKWILNKNWIIACMQEGEAVPEEPYEITNDIHGDLGARTGRIRAMEKKPDIFTGLSFFICEDVIQCLSDLILAGGGTIAYERDLPGIERAYDEGFFRNVCIVYSTKPPSEGDSRDPDEVLWQKVEEAKSLAARIAGMPVGDGWLLNKMAACQPIRFISYFG